MTSNKTWIQIKRLLLSIAKIILGVLAYLIGILAGGFLNEMLWIPVPALPTGADAATLGLYQAVISLLFVLTLVCVSRNISGRYSTRWFVMTTFSWIAFSLNTYLEAKIFTAFDAASVYMLIYQFCACFVTAGVVAWLFPPRKLKTDVGMDIRSFFNQYPMGGWVWRLLATLLTFPAAYLLFGLMVGPFVTGFYEQQYAGLVLPGWGEILPTLFLRSLLFFAACLPVVLLWQRSRRTLILILGSALFMLVGGLYMLQSYWYPTIMRVAHSLEILADSFVYAGAVGFLWWGSRIGQEKPGK